MQKAPTAPSLCRVLVVDDEDANLDTFRRVFRKDFDMAFARSAAEAIAKLETQTFDVALVDYAMPDMNGIDFLKRAATLQPEMARLMVTAHEGLSELRDSRASGLAISIISKPWQREQVMHWVTTAQRMAEMRRSVARLNDTLKR
jgi:CheY-like chemotaxis protein